PVTQIVRSAQVWVCDACGCQDDKSCGCNSTAHMEALAAKKEAKRQADRARQQENRKTQQNQGPVANSTLRGTENTKESTATDETDHSPRNMKEAPTSMRISGFEYRAREAYEGAVLDDLGGVEITEAFCALADQAAKAWNEIANSLRSRRR